MKISVVSPVYGAPNSINELVERVSKNLFELVGEDFEIILVNDDCPNGSWLHITEACKLNAHVIGVNLSRNFGQHKAIAAGLSIARGDWVVVMDCDLQDLPEEIPKLYNTALNGAEVVFGRRVSRVDSFIKRMSSKVFYKVYDFLTGFDTDHTIANFSVISRKVVDSYNAMPEQHRPYNYFINWLGFNRLNVDIKHAQRTDGQSSYTFSKLIELALDSIISETNKPLKIAIKLGFTFSLISFTFGLYLILKWFSGGIVEGWTSVMVSIFFATGILLANLGLVGLYIGKIFDETKKRPVFVISQTLNLDIEPQNK